MVNENELEIKDIPIVKEFLEERKTVEKLQKQSAERKIPAITMETAEVLEAICFVHRPVNILEIGCGTGFSTYYIVKHFLHLKEGGFAHDNNDPNPEGYMLRYTGIDLNKKRLLEARDYIEGLFSIAIKKDGKSSPKIDFICGNAINLIPELKGGFDMVFIDAAKMEYPEYLAVLEGKMSEGCIVLADNIFYSGKVFNDFTSGHDKNSVRGIRQYIKKITDTKYFSTVFLNTGDGIAISVYKKNT